VTADETLATLSLIRTFRRIACDCERQAKHYRQLATEYGGTAFPRIVDDCNLQAHRARSEARGWLKRLRNWKEFYREQ
jgi:hypothetical protein